MSEALVLGGGGVAGIAWITGLLLGAAETGHDLTVVDLVVGTSAGATVAAQLGSGLSLEELYARQVDPTKQSEEIPADIDLSSFAEQMGRAVRRASTPRAMRKSVGTFATKAKTVAPSDRRRVIEQRLPSHVWPLLELRIVAVDAHSGEPRVFDRDSGVALVDAVAASCAVPGIWPPVDIGGRRYIDGGVRSSANADLATGASKVTVILPLGGGELLPTETPLEVALEMVRAAGGSIAVIEPDQASSSAIGSNPLDPGTRGPAAAAGRAQGRECAWMWQ